MVNKKNKYFFIEKPHLKHLLFIFYFIVAFALHFANDFIMEKISNLSTPFFDIYIYIISDSLCFIPYLIVKFRTKSISTSTLTSGNNNGLIYNNQESFSFKKTLKNIFLLTFSDYIAQISMVIYFLIKQEYKLDVPYLNLNSIIIFNILFLVLLSKKILNMRFYTHHYFSFIIIIITLCILVILDIIQIFGGEGNKLLSLIYLILRIFQTFLYSFEDVIGKVILLYSEFTVYFLLLNKALIQLIFSIIFSIPFIFIKIKDEEDNKRSIFEMIGEIFENKSNILKYGLYIIIVFFHNIFIWQIIDKFTPNHFWLAQVFESLGVLIITLIQDSISLDICLRIIMFIILLLIACIYNEFLVVNICGLSKDTKLFLDYKEKEDLFLTEITDEASSRDSNLDSSHDDIESNKAKKEFEVEMKPI